MYSTYKAVENISKAFASKVKPAKAKLENAREAAVQAEVVMAKRCQEIGIGLSQARQGRFERIKPSLAIELGDLNIELNMHGNSVQAALAASQIRLADSKANLNDEEAKKKGGPDTNLANAEIGKIDTMIKEMESKV